jgi:hypothetical protein
LGAIQIAAKRRSCVVIGKNTLLFSRAKREEMTTPAACPPTRHCERSEAIHAGTLDCFTAFAMTEDFRVHSLDGILLRTPQSQDDGRDNLNDREYKTASRIPAQYTETVRYRTGCR